MNPGDHMARAARALASARLLLADDDVRGACNRAYYAMFDAAHAALLTRLPDLNPAAIKTHAGLVGAFGLHLVKPGHMDMQFGRMLNQVEQVRLLSDYTGEEIDADKAAWAVEQAALFLGEMRARIESGK